MDTRSKIVAPDRVPPGCAVVTGTFDVIQAEDARELAAIRAESPHSPLCAVVLPLAGELLPRRARAELAAALRVIDYVIAEDIALDTLKPARVVRLEEVHATRKRQLMEHVHSRQSR